MPVLGTRLTLDTIYPWNGKRDVSSIVPEKRVQIVKSNKKQTIGVGVPNTIRMRIFLKTKLING